MPKSAWLSGQAAYLGIFPLFENILSK